MSSYSMTNAYMPIKEKVGVIRNTTNYTVEYAITDGNYPVKGDGKVLYNGRSVSFDIMSAIYDGQTVKNQQLWARCVCDSGITETLVVDCPTHDQTVTYNITGISEWHSSCYYDYKQIVIHNNTFYRANKTHISTTWDMDVGNWVAVGAVATDDLAIYLTADEVRYMMKQTATEIEDGFEKKLEYYATWDMTAKAINTKLEQYETIEALDKRMAYIYSKQETAKEIDTSLKKYTNDTLINYYKKTETAEYVTTEIGNALGDYYNKTETANAIITSLQSSRDYTDNTLANTITNYYTKEETAAKINTSMQTYVDGRLTNYYTKTETADAITTEIGKVNTTLTNDYVKQTMLNDKITAINEAVDAAKNEAVTSAVTSANNNTSTVLASYYTKAETADAITTSLTSYVTKDNMNTVIGNFYTKTETADKISTELQSYTKTTGLEAYLASSSTITQMSNNINAKVAKNDVISQINISTEGVTIDGSKIHITGDTTFDKNVIVGDMLSAETITLTDKQGISGGAVTLDANGLSCTTDTGGKVQFNSSGMSFVDSNNKSFSSIGRFAAGFAKHGETVNLDWDVTPTSILLVPSNVQTTVGGYSSDSLYVQCYYDNVSASGFTVHCFTTLAAGSYWQNSVSASTGTMNAYYTLAVWDIPSQATQLTFSGALRITGGYGYSAGADTHGNFSYAIYNCRGTVTLQVLNANDTSQVCASWSESINQIGSFDYATTKDKAQHAVSTHSISGIASVSNVDSVIVRIIFSGQNLDEMSIIPFTLVANVSDDTVLSSGSCMYLALG